MSGGAALLLAAAVCAGAAQRVDDSASSQERSYLGFDRNDYPGDAALPALRRSFRYTGYWLNHPPGETQNSWAGKRASLRQQGFGFLVLFSGRTDAELKAAESKGQEAAVLGTADGKAAVAVALREGFSLGVLIFLDQEEGGRLLPEQATYLFAWVDAVRGAGARAGVYCSGIVVREGTGTISTAADACRSLSQKPEPGQSPCALGGQRPVSACTRMHFCRAAFDCGALAGDCGLCKRLAVCAVTAPGAVQRQLSCQPGLRQQLLRARAARKCGHLCGSGYGEFA
jgi:hypothetical protein